MSSSSFSVLVASFGFDIDFVLRKLATGEFNRVVLFALYTGEESFRRVEKAYHTLSVVCRSLGIDCKIEKIEPSKIMRSVLSVVKGIVESSEVNKVIIYLTGGPRILVVSMLLSTLLVTSSSAEKIEVVVEGEGFECELYLNLLRYAELLKLDERDRRIVFELQTRGPQRLSELEDNTRIPRSTLFRRLEDLEKKKLVRKEDDKYIAEEVINTRCKS